MAVGVAGRPVGVGGFVGVELTIACAEAKTGVDTVHNAPADSNNKVAKEIRMARLRFVI